MGTVLNCAAFGVTTNFFFFVTGFRLFASFSTEGITLVGLATNLSWLSWSTGILGMVTAGLRSLSDLGRLGLVLMGAVTEGRGLGDGVSEIGATGTWMASPLVTRSLITHDYHVTDVN